MWTKENWGKKQKQRREKIVSDVHIHDARISTSALDKVVHVLVLDSKSIFIKSSLKYLQMYVATITFFNMGYELQWCWNICISMEYRTIKKNWSGLYEDENFQLVINDLFHFRTTKVSPKRWKLHKRKYSSAPLAFFLPEMMPSEADFAPARVTQLRGRSRRKRICLVMRGLSSGMSIISPLLWWFVYQRIYLVGCKQVKNKDATH